MRTRRLLIPLIASLLGVQPALGSEMGRYLTPAFVAELAEFLRLPNDARDRAALEPNLAWLEAAFTRRGFAVQDLSDPDYALLFAERPAAAPARTVLFYFHFDGQPVDPAQWLQPSPYEPVLKVPVADGGFVTVPWTTEVSDPETRVFARSASDDKGPIVMLLHALDQLAARDLTITTHIKVILDGKEERGSPGLALKIAGVRERLAADFLLVLDGPAHFTNQPTLMFGCRGMARLTLTTYGPAAPQHSGHFGNVAPNPVFALADLLASMKDNRGRVQVEGFYDGVVISPDERAMIDAAPDDPAALRQRLQVPALEAVGSSYQEALQYPSLNVRRLRSPLFAGTRTIVPDRAEAELDIRLVPETEGQDLIKRIAEHVRDQGFYVVDGEPTRAERLQHARIATVAGRLGVPPFQTPRNSEIGQFLIAALREEFGEPPIQIPLMGGTVPITPFIKLLGFPAVIVPLVNSDNNQHSPNENLRLGNAALGIRTLQALLR
jgi:acetylornithine deacetylase/succinyl-diaminopimelate desuccinylase-like protein